MPKGSSGSVKVFYPSYSRGELVAILEQRLPALTAVLPVKRAVLFGSWAEGRATAFSDIDLLLIYADPAQEDAYKLARRLLNLRGLEAHVYSEDQADKLKATIERMTQNGVVLFPGSQVRR